MWQEGLRSTAVLCRSPQGSRAVQTSSGTGMMSAEQGVQWEHLWSIHSKGGWHCVGTTGMQCPPSPWCWGEGLNWRHRPSRAHLSQSLNVKTCDQRWRIVWGCGSPRGPPASMTPTVTMCLPVCKGKVGDPGPLSEGHVLCILWTCLGLSHTLGRDAAQPSGEGGLLGKAKTCFQGANCIYSWIHMNFKMLPGICT